MLVYVQCTNSLVKGYSVAINPDHVVAIIDAGAGKELHWSSLILTTTGVEYHSTESYLELVAKFNTPL